MIDKPEIMEHAKLFNLSPNTIEKDYVLNWLLAGIAKSVELKKQWIFKGGTCLKKCYFKEYRFSEDLDFTITNPSHLDEEFLRSTFYKIAENIYENSGIEIPKEKIAFEVYKNTRSQLSVQGKIAYRGPMGRRSSEPTIKLDLNWDEILVEPPVLREIHHPYSDHAFNNTTIPTYSIEEIFAEKLRALVQRMSPRDLYDIIHLHRDERWRPNREKVLTILKKKCEFKNIETPTLSAINSLSTKEDLIADWENMLTNQIASLKPYSYYWERLSDVFFWLYGT